MSISHHDVLIDAFRSISGESANALGWVCLDTKFERFMTAAISTAINRRAGKRLAHVEFSSGKKQALDGCKEARLDLVILEERIPSRQGRSLDASAARIRMRYEAKAGQLFDFAPTANTDEKYLGAALDDDMRGLRFGAGAGLFFISEIANPTRFLKRYAVGHVAQLDHALSVLSGKITRGQLVTREVMDCGEIDETKVKIHMCVFDPHQRP
ncbi:MAG TPA: hypothetical protein VK932_08875 [Kofleriaceae bacterium]|nr:hypothetical protein [Kofleriaceae bacterium]